MWNVIASLDVRAAAAQAEGERLVGELAGFHPAAGVDDVGRLELVVSLPAESARTAAVAGLAVIEAAAGRPVVAAQVLAAAEFDVRNGAESLPELVGVSEAAELLGVSRQAVLQMVEAGRLPSGRAGKVVVLSRTAVALEAERRAANRA